MVPFVMTELCVESHCTMTFRAFFGLSMPRFSNVKQIGIGKNGADLIELCNI